MMRVLYMRKPDAVILPRFASERRAAVPLFYWCRRRESNPHAKDLARDFKGGAIG